jgi:hypothetical protein
VKLSSLLLSLAFCFVVNAQADYVDLPIGGGPVMTPSSSPTPSPSAVAGPTLKPGVLPTPSFQDFYNPPIIVPAPAAMPTFEPLPVVSVSPLPEALAAPAAPAITEAVSHLLPPITLSVFGGGDFVSLSEINQLVGTSLFQSAAYYGAEIRYPISYDFSLLLRAERMSSSSSIGAAAFSLTALPVDVGLDYLVVHERKLRIHLSALVGAAINTSLTETASSLPNPNVTQFSSTAMTEMLRLNVEIPLTHRIGVFGEGGYRFLKTSSSTPSETGSGGTLFQINGQYQPVPLNLGGPFVGGGLIFAL